MRQGSLGNHIGPYQRPAPPKKPIGLNAPHTVQKPVVPIYEIQAQEQRLLEDIKANGNVLGITAKTRKPGRPSVYEEPMTSAERQARHRAFEARERGIQDALRISDAKGKSRLEAVSGGYGSTELDILGACPESRVSPKPAADDRGHNVQVRGLQCGDQESNRRRFAEDELKKMVGEYFTLPAVVKAPSTPWVATYVGNTYVQRHEHPSLVFTCKECGKEIEFIENAMDHLRVDHKKIVAGWFQHLKPPREFRDMGNFVTVVMPRKR